MSLILCIETATDICSIGLSEDGQVRHRRESSRAYEHAAQITLLIEACMRDAGRSLRDLAAIAVSRGPGSYTSLRIGTSAAKGICYALEKPLLAIDTLQSLALAARRPDDGDALYCPMIDARRMEVYTALYDAGNRPLSPPQAMVIDEEAFQEHFQAGNNLVFCGNGAPKCEPILQHPLAHFRSVRCSADHLAPLAEQALAQQQLEDVAYYTPFYLKPPNITKPKRTL